MSLSNWTLSCAVEEVGGGAKGKAQERVQLDGLEQCVELGMRVSSFWSFLL